MHVCAVECSIHCNAATRRHLRHPGYDLRPVTWARSPSRRAESRFKSAGVAASPAHNAARLSRESGKSAHVEQFSTNGDERTLDASPVNPEAAGSSPVTPQLAVAGGLTRAEQDPEPVRVSSPLAVVGVRTHDKTTAAGGA